MKTIGILGGMSWQSSQEFYRLLNEGMQERFGGHHSAPCLMYSFNFEEIARVQHSHDWSALEGILIEGAQRVERGGADFLVICSNTVHRWADIVQSHINIPLLHIADSTGKAVEKGNFKKVGLLGTKFTMEKPFYKKKLEADFGLNIIVPTKAEREEVHHIIYEELCKGNIKEDSAESYRRIIKTLVEKGAEAVILGCTEITLLVDQKDASIPLLDTTSIHARATLDYALDQL